MDLYGSTVEDQIRPPSTTASERRKPLKNNLPRSSQLPPIKDKISKLIERNEESTQKKQKALILETIINIKTKLNAVIPHEIKKRPHQVRVDKLDLVSLNPGKNGIIVRQRISK